MRTIQRKKTVEGTTVAGIINNGGSYFHIDLEIFEDGMVDAWELYDLAQFAQMMNARSWVVSQIPDGEILSIHALGSYRVVSAQWAHDPESYLRLIDAKLTELNPDRSNLYTVTARERALNKQRRITRTARGEPFRVVKETGYSTEPGKETHLFMRHENRYLLVNLCVFKSGAVEITHPDFTQSVSLDELEKLWRDGCFFTHFATPTEVSCGELGLLNLVNDDATWFEELANKREEIQANFGELQGASRHKACREAYCNYLENPNDFTRERLREAYENVPEHERMYLGDMNSRDVDYQRILYSDEKREV